MKIEFKNFNKNYPLHLACGLDDKIRTSLHYIMFKDGYAYATNSYILVRAKLEDISNFDEEDINKLDGFYIHAQSFKAELPKHSEQQKSTLAEISDAVVNIIKATK